MNSRPTPVYLRPEMGRIEEVAWFMSIRQNRSRPSGSTRRAVVLTCLSTLIALMAGGGLAAAQNQSTGPSAPTGDATGGIRAAAITYRWTAPPAGVPASYVAPPGTKLRFFTYTAIDGVQDQGTLFQPDNQPPKDTTVVIQIHGGGATYLSDPIVFLAPRLAAKGYATLSINDRGYGKYQNTDNFFAIRRDIQAAVYIAQSLGYRQIVLEGHSLGTVQVLYYAATAWNPDIKGVILLSPFADLPWKTRYLLVNNDPVYKELYTEALQAVRAGHPDEVLPTKMPFLLGSTTTVTAQHFLTYRWDYESAAVSTHWIRRVPDPILMVRDASDKIVRRWEPTQLYAAATNYGTLVPSIKNVLLPDSNPANGHSFPNNKGPLTDLIVQWLVGLNL